MHHLPLIALLCLVAPMALAEQLTGDVYSPRPGVVCDRKAQFCADSNGISLALTRENLGAQAEAVMQGRIRDAGGPSNYDLAWFGLSNGVDCKASQRVCHVSKHSDQVDAAHTRALFGR